MKIWKMRFPWISYVTACMRPDALSRQFKQVMGKGYTEYIKEKKMARVLELLAE